VPTSLPLRSLLTALALAAVVAGTAGCGPRQASTEACFAAVNRGFVASRAAAQRTFEACFRGTAAKGVSVADCLAADPFGWIGAARAHALAAEARACRDATPAFGSAGAAAAHAAAVDAVAELGRGLLGPAPDAARVPVRDDARGALCQRSVLDAAGRCAAAFASEYEACAGRAFATADDVFDLVSCKGADPRGALARACDDGIAAALARCRGAETAALFPGCSGDVAACARGHARRSASAAVNEAGALCQDVLPGTLAEPQLLQCFEPPPPEPIVFSDVALPPGVNAIGVEWSDDGEGLVLQFRADGVDGTQLASVRPDGSGFRCLTCGTGLGGNLRPIQRFADGRRLLVAGPHNATPRWNVLECTPGLDDCQSSQLLPIQLPANPDPLTPILQYRVPWVSLDDAWLIWTEVRLRGPGGNLSAMGRLVRDAGRYVVTDARVIAPPVRSLALGTDSEVWRRFTQPFEAKFGALRGGRDWVEAGTPSAGQYDTSVIDLATGELRRLTRHPDHDEGIQFSRDEEWAVLQSARTDGRVEFLGLVPRPPYVDWTAFSIHFVGIAGAPDDGISPGGPRAERDCYVDPWLLDRGFERGDYLGQRLLKPEGGWVSIEGNAAGFGWSPDGTRIALIERRWRHGVPAGETRLRIARLANREPIRPADVVPIAPTPEPTWAIRYEDWIVPDTSGVTVIPGRASGTATIRNAMGSAVQGELEVVYDDYSDDGLSWLDGFERIRIPIVVLVGAEYEVDLTLRGLHEGSMRGSIAYDFVADVNRGEVVSELDGRVLRGPRTCFEAGLIPLP